MYAAMDLGSNSFHLLICDWVNEEIIIVERCSEKVQLGEGVSKTGIISPESFARGLDCLSNFKKLMSNYSIKKCWALGTNTLRVAKNAAEFLSAAQTQGIQIKVISGIQEAILIYAGVCMYLPKAGRWRLAADIGGGSTEIVLGRDSQRIIAESMEVGSVSWRDRFFLNLRSESEANKQLDLAVSSAKSEFSRISTALKQKGWDEAYASSGTVKMLMHVSNGNGNDSGSDTISLNLLLNLRLKILKSSLNDEPLNGLKDSRRDLLLSGWSILVGFMQSFEILEIQFSPFALREGMIDFMAKNELV
jgi:exopolyphosphatase/guanosine-5'-triphosphate,3'-diphosphate pyrophosphatase